MNRDETIKFIIDSTMGTAEVLKYLGISKSRLSELKSLGKLEPIMMGYYLKEDVEKRKEEQVILRDKYYKPAKKED